MHAKSIALAGLVLLSGCGSPAPASSLTPDQSCTDLAAARCNAEFGCDPNSVVIHYGDIPTCEMREKAACLNRLVAKGTSTTPAFEEGCAQGLPLYTCIQLFENQPQPACIAPPGALADGAPCIANGQCAGGNCNLGERNVCGTCGQPAQAGDDCDDATCDTGLICFGVPGVCLQAGATGAPCDKNNPCEIDQSCVGSTATAMGTCQQAAAMLGASCDAGQTTAAGCELAQRLSCNPSTKMCESTQYPAVGMPCGRISSVTIECAAGAQCFPGGSATSTCLADAADGAACDVVNGPGCLSPAKCVGTGTSGTCQLPDPTTCM